MSLLHLRDSCPLWKHAEKTPEDTAVRGTSHEDSAGQSPVGIARQLREASEANHFRFFSFHFFLSSFLFPFRGLSLKTRIFEGIALYKSSVIYLS